MSGCRERSCWRHHRPYSFVNPDFVFSCGDVPTPTELLLRALSDPTRLARAPFDGCSPGPPERISAEYRRPSSELFHEPKQRKPFLEFGSACLFHARRLFSNAKINAAWSIQIQLRSRWFFPLRESAPLSVLANEIRRVDRFVRFSPK